MSLISWISLISMISLISLISLVTPMPRGDGRFEFGSTLVMAGRAGAFELDVREPGTPLGAGEPIGRLDRAAVA